jgi:cellulose synthase/poly-beta-1,6-N-acetylglucosamine synthase-like glycosyltransferase
MHELAISLSKSLLTGLAIQMVFVSAFLLYLRSPSVGLRPSLEEHVFPDDKLPKTAVILCLRGPDPFLPKCLQGLLNQNYPNYDIKLIVDSQQDIAWKIAHDTIREQQATNIEVHLLKIPRLNCSLKCSSLVQAVSDLDDSYKVVALVDADTIAHPNWLRELVTPLAHPKVGATTGNRWYVPTGSWASLVRYLWNIAAIVQMYVFGISWGGTLAIKTELLHQGLLDKWGQAFCEDTMMRRALAKKGMRIKFVPSLIMVNREECDFSYLTNWLKRQMLCSRLYHPCWWAVVSDALSSVLLPIVVFTLLLTAVLTKQWSAATILFTSFFGYTVGLILLAIALDNGVHEVVSDNGEKIPKLSLGTIAKMLIGIPLTHWIYAFAMISSQYMGKVKWRGVTYQVKGPWNIRLVQYTPYQLLNSPINSKTSL